LATANPEYSAIPLPAGFILKERLPACLRLAGKKQPDPNDKNKWFFLRAKLLPYYYLQDLCQNREKAAYFKIIKQYQGVVLIGEIIKRCWEASNMRLL
jgi:hypothetical protein